MIGSSIVDGPMIEFDPFPRRVQPIRAQEFYASPAHVKAKVAVSKRNDSTESITSWKKQLSFNTFRPVFRRQRSTASRTESVANKLWTDLLLISFIQKIDKSEDEINEEEGRERAVKLALTRSAQCLTSKCDESDFVAVASFDSNFGVKGNNERLRTQSLHDVHGF